LGEEVERGGMCGKEKGAGETEGMEMRGGEKGKGEKKKWGKK